MSVLCFSAVGVFALNMRNFHDYRILNVYWTVIQLYIVTVYSFIAVIIKLWLAWVSTNYRGFMNLLFFSYRWQGYCFLNIFASTSSLHKRSYRGQLVYVSKKIVLCGFCIIWWIIIEKIIISVQAIVYTLWAFKYNMRIKK